MRRAQIIILEYHILERITYVRFIRSIYIYIVQRSVRAAIDHVSEAGYTYIQQKLVDLIGQRM